MVQGVQYASIQTIAGILDHLPEPSSIEISVNDVVSVLTKKPIIEENIPYIVNSYGVKARIEEPTKLNIIKTIHQAYPRAFSFEAANFFLKPNTQPINITLTQLKIEIQYWDAKDSEAVGKLLANIGKFDDIEVLVIKKQSMINEFIIQG